jgi:hypothetical protein
MRQAEIGKLELCQFVSYVARDILIKGAGYTLYLASFSVSILNNNLSL